MPTKSNSKLGYFYQISGTQIHKYYVKNKMTVHFQGMSKTMQFPQTIFLQGALTCSVGISPEGLYNRLNDAGRLVFLNQKSIQLASAPFIKFGDKTFMLTTKKPEIIECPDDIPVSERYYHPPVTLNQTTISLATPSAEMSFEVEKLNIKRKMYSPLFSGNKQAFMPIGVEEYEVTNNSKQTQQVTLVIPRPSLVNLQEKKYRPIDQDSAYICFTPLKGHKHEEFQNSGLTGVLMGSTDSDERMLIAVPEVAGVKVDTQPYFRLNSLKQDLLLNVDGSFFQKYQAKLHSDYGAAISLTFELNPKASVTIPVAIVFDFPNQWYEDGMIVERPYVKYFSNKDTRTKDMAKVALENYEKWRDRTEEIQKRVYDFILKDPTYKNDKETALKLTRLIFNEFAIPIANASASTTDKDGNEVVRFVECFDYPYNNSSDVDWFSMILLVIFPQIEQELCQRAIDSILEEDLTERYYHIHASFIEAQHHFETHPEQYAGLSLTHIKAPTKIKGSVSHDLGAMTFGCPLRNKSEYTWYNTNYWIDLYPKLALRVLRNVKYTGNIEYVKKNWETLKFGFEYLMKLDYDKDCIPEGNPNEVKNTFDNIHLFGIDSYSTNGFLASCKALAKLADMMGDAEAKKKFEDTFDKGYAVYQKLWIDKKVKNGRLQYFATCFDPATGKKNTDVWTNQLDGLWYLIAMGEEPFMPAQQVIQTLKTIYKVNRTPMGWATARTQDGKPVESDQGKDVWLASNYILAQLLDYYGLSNESKEVYKLMDKIIYEYGNTLITPESVRPTFEKEKGETKKGPHYIVAGYPRPGAIFSQLMFLFVKETQKETKNTIIGSEKLISFLDNVFLRKS